ncbi:MAG: prepilin-type N-terminal cleavage/methylation domain-containing protein [Desulfovibrio sp.]|nr:prepilin-type N-terminal cleavage/methylation domain-containing protein [Desulfovibrio sp.]MBI4958203.1 prepilin-type N-terminal cleavage/methylation domain-containing protein [Desulfovibrio sp.]
MPRDIRGQSASQGFTLKELAVTLVLVAIIGVVVMSRRSTTNYDAYADAETLKGALRNTRTRAMADIVPWSFVVSGQTGTLQRNGVDHSTITFATGGVAAGTVTFSTRGVPSGTMSFAVTDCSYSPVVITPGTGYVP